MVEGCSVAGNDRNADALVVILAASSTIIDCKKTSAGFGLAVDREGNLSADPFISASEPEKL